MISSIYVVDRRQPTILSLSQCTNKDQEFKPFLCVDRNNTTEAPRRVLESLQEELYLGQPTDIVIKPPPSARVF
jgi:hypothetical protein